MAQKQKTPRKKGFKKQGLNWDASQDEDISYMNGGN